MNILLHAAAFSLAALAGTMLTEKDPVGAIRRSLESRCPGFIIISLGAGFVLGLANEILT
jgi:hypothetical protein